MGGEPPLIVNKGGERSSAVKRTHGYISNSRNTGYGALSHAGRHLAKSNAITNGMTLTALLCLVGLGGLIVTHAVKIDLPFQYHMLTAHPTMELMEWDTDHWVPTKACDQQAVPSNIQARCLGTLIFSETGDLDDPSTHENLTTVVGLSGNKVDEQQTVSVDGKMLAVLSNTYGLALAQSSVDLFSTSLTSPRAQKAWKLGSRLKAKASITTGRTGRMSIF